MQTNMRPEVFVKVVNCILSELLLSKAFDACIPLFCTLPLKVHTRYSFVLFS